MVILQQINKNQTVKLLDAINCEGADNQFWDVSSYKDSWNAGEVFGGTNQTESEPGDYITVMYDDEKPRFLHLVRISTLLPVFRITVTGL